MFKSLTKQSLMLKTKLFKAIISCFFGLNLASCSNIIQSHDSDDTVTLDDGVSVEQNLYLPPIKQGEFILVDDNSDYFMVIDKSTISPKEVFLEGGTKKNIIQAWIYIFYRKPYEPYVVGGNFEPSSSSKLLTYVSIEDNTSTTKASYFYKEDGSLHNSFIVALKDSDFKARIPETIGGIQISLIKAHQNNQ